MIDTDKYEGHTPGPWVHYKMGADEPYNSVHANGWETWGIQVPITHNADARLIAAAPDLLAFYLRIKEIMDMEEIEEIVRVELILQEMDE
jgi:hypothetical protein